ncbi:protein transport protein Sec31A-like [Centruroides sculpturatus]|uniref:protein transport protein Sec31A-like n=1 Tax=Centruroides sculpturatus TaxID=218467 RepID=UPI000C6C8E68|nr:protein transport protein Sec31A-like [Centruroides sculpturatus]
MKVKEIDRTANIAWSPANHHPIYLVAGTAAQQLDATFSTTAALEIYDLNLTEPDLDMELKGSIVSEYRFHKVVWGCHGVNNDEYTSGIIVGGADGGNLLLYDPVKLLQNESAVVCHKNMHTGAVRSLDFNIFQPNLLASGASESEIFVWDLNNPTKPMVPGKSQPLEDVTCVAWNRQVQHILASAFPARCIVWDLRKTEPIIKVSDTTSRIRCKVVAWHPEVATQLCLASEDDNHPVIQLWDLRFATVPLKTLEHHQRGVLSIAWCPRDPDLLLSCGKDNMILCWNPNSNIQGDEVVCELPTSDQWCFDVAWCHRNPAIIASSSFDGHVSIYSLMGGQRQVKTSSKIAESFPGSDTFAQPPIPQNTTRQVSVYLRKPPKWLRRPVGAKFGFGGKLVMFTHEKKQSGQQLPQNIVNVSSVITESELINRATKLESALSTDNLNEFCQVKLNEIFDKQEKLTWDFIQAMLNSSPRTKMINLLGYNSENISSQIGKIIKQKEGKENKNDFESNKLASQLSSLNVSEEIESHNENTNVFEMIASEGKGVDNSPFLITCSEDSDEDLLNQALLTGNISEAVELCIMNKQWADALILAQAEGKTLLQKTQSRYFRAMTSISSKLISAIVNEDWEHVVQTCDIDCWKEILIALLTHAKPDIFSKVCESLGTRLETEKSGSLIKNAILCYICAGNLEKLSQCWLKIQEFSFNPILLQGLVEEIMVLRCAVERLSGVKPIISLGTLSSLLNQYATLLASQGSLSIAATFLVDTQEQSTLILKDRIYQSLGLQSTQRPFPQVNVKENTMHQVNPPISKSVPQAQNYSYHPVSQYGPTTMQPSSNFNYPPASNFQYQPMQPPPPAMPPSTGSQPGTPVNQTAPPIPPVSENMNQNIQTRSHIGHRYPSHLHDPSVYTEPSYNQSPYGYVPPSSSHMQSNYMHPQSIPQQSYQQPEYSSPPTYTLANTSIYAPNSINAPANTSVPQSMPSMPPVPPPPSQPSMFTPASYEEIKSAWNDPPPLTASQKVFPQSVPFQDNYEITKGPSAYFHPSLAMQTKAACHPPTTTYQTFNPITTPIVGAPVSEPMPPPPASISAPQGNYFVPNYQNQYQQSQPPPQPQPPKPAPEPVKEKGPIPPEHQILQDIFEDLRHQCQQVATNPQVKRKLDELSKKMENLYDKLRENSLTSGVILALHQIIQSIQQGDYQGALAIHSQLVSTANFSEISSFMPGIKVLLQTAQQLGVYLQ